MTDRLANDELEKEVIPSSPLFPSDNVCSRCRAVPWGEITQPSRYQRQVMQLLESHEQLNSASCRVCRCLAKIKPPSLDGKNCGLMQCSATWAFDINTGIDKQEEITLSGSNLLYVYSESQYSREHVQKNGALCLFKSRQHYDIGIQPTDSSTIPFAALRGCIAHCRRNHYQACVRKLFPNASVFKLRVIDCRDPTRKVIQVPTDCRYVALSYVWGNISNSSSTQYPKTVEDAIVATLSMELQYLWVDAYVSHSSFHTEGGY